MIASFKECRLKGKIDAPPSKSMAHRYLISAALSGEKCTLTGVDYSEDILATIDCLRSLGASVESEKDAVTVEPFGFMKKDEITLECRESGSTLRFFVPLALRLGKKVTFVGSERLFERPLSVYEDLCREKGFLFEKGKGSLSVCGNLESGKYIVSGSVSSQFISGLVFALVSLKEDSYIEITPPFESRPYVDMTLSVLSAFGADVRFDGENKIIIKKSRLHRYSGRIEGDYSNAAFLEAFNRTGSDIEIGNLDENSLQGDKVFYSYFDEIEKGIPTLDISSCPDLGPVLFALSAMKNGATFTGTDRLKAKESDRGAAMQRELSKLGGEMLFGDNEITVKKTDLEYRGEILSGHNDHRIVMALSLVLAKTGGKIEGAEAVRKSYPKFFDDLLTLGAEVELL